MKKIIITMLVALLVIATTQAKPVVKVTPKKHATEQVVDQNDAAQDEVAQDEAVEDDPDAAVEEAVQALIAERGLGKSFTGTIEYHGFKIVVSRPKSYTWEKNTNPAITSDPNHAIYVQQLALQEQIAAQLKDMRADVKRTAEKLAKAHPDSDSIKHSYRIALGKEKESE